MSKEEKEEKVKVIRDELDRVGAISSLADSKGGKILKAKLIKDIVENVETLCLKYKTLTLQEFVGICSDINGKFDMIKTFKTAKKSKKIALEDLNTALEELKEEE